MGIEAEDILASRVFDDEDGDGEANGNGNDNGRKDQADKNDAE